MLNRSGTVLGYLCVGHSVTQLVPSRNVGSLHEVQVVIVFSQVKQFSQSKHIEFISS